jgi:hypothetical protein
MNIYFFEHDPNRLASYCMVLIANTEEDARAKLEESWGPDD